jgi:ribonuclease-3
VAPKQTPSPLGEEDLERLRELQKRIGIQFRKQELLREAMTHASWNNEHGEPAGPGHDNERLEYLGDAVLELVVGEYLFRRFPTYDEGQLTQLRAALVNTTSLARLGERLQLGETLLMGRGAVKTGARKLPSLLANAFEAMIGAIFLDQGYRAATKVFLQNIGDLAEWSDENFKGQLQQASQDRTGDTPHYRVIATGGPGHKREYTAEVLLGDRVGGTGRGPTKQAAEQAAAHDALDKLSKTSRGGAAAAVGAARDAAKTVASEPARVRRRVAEVAADRGATPRRRRGRSGSHAPEAVAVTPGLSTPKRSRSLLSALRHAAEALVGRQQAAPPPPTEATAPAPRRRRGRRGGRGRGGGSTPTVQE